MTDIMLMVTNGLARESISVVVGFYIGAALVTWRRGRAARKSSS